MTITHDAGAGFAVTEAEFNQAMETLAQSVAEGPAAGGTVSALEKEFGARSGLGFAGQEHYAEDGDFTALHEKRVATVKRANRLIASVVQFDLPWHQLPIPDNLLEGVISVDQMLARRKSRSTSGSSNNQIALDSNSSDEPDGSDPDSKMRIEIAQGPPIREIINLESDLGRIMPNQGEPVLELLVGNPSRQNKRRYSYYNLSERQKEINQQRVDSMDVGNINSYGALLNGKLCEMGRFPEKAPSIILTRIEDDVITFVDLGGNVYRRAR